MLASVMMRQRFSSVVRELKNFGRDVDSFLPKRIG
jgi:phosphopantetheine adenylyltransferase